MFNESIIIDIYEKVLQDKNASPEYNILRRKCIEQRDKFETNLTEEQRKELDNLIEERAVMDEVELREFFIEGFKRGAKIVSEVLCSKT